MFTQSILVTFIYMTVVFIIAQIKKDNSIVDIFWGLGFIVLAVFTLVQTSLFTPLHIITALLITIWGVRLSFHIFSRNAGKPEDFRYKKWREEWGKWVVPRAFLQVFMLQGFFMLVIALPVLFINTSAAMLSIYTLVGVLVWLFGFLFESIGDWQLKQFIKTKKKGQIMTKGLWRYTRHPNYFGEAVQWWGLAIIALPISVWALISPIAITLLLRFVSGVPMLEKKYDDNKAYQKYKQHTNAFFPWFTKK